MIPGRLKTFVQSVISPRKHMQSTFAPFYTENRWGDGESKSGPGSNLTRTAKLRNELPLLLHEIGARTLLDAPCGDFNWMKDTSLGLELYFGVDIIPELIARNRSLYGNERRQFVLLDLTRDWLPWADVMRFNKLICAICG